MNGEADERREGDVITLAEDASEALECLVRCCKELLAGDDSRVHLVQFPKDIEYESECIKNKVEHGDKVEGPVWKESYSENIDLPNCSGNLYALYIRPCSGSNWTLKYIGKSKTLRTRLLEHVARVSKSTSSQLWRVAHEVSAGNQIGVCSVDVVSEEAVSGSEEVNMALAAYVESRMIDIVGIQCLWNTRTG